MGQIFRNHVRWFFFFKRQSFERNHVLVSQILAHYILLSRMHHQLSLILIRLLTAGALRIFLLLFSQIGLFAHVDWPNELLVHLMAFLGSQWAEVDWF